ncbi:MAG TPA: hypothetical protein VJP80_01965 [Candidatus Saccharimonadales bacterium]|nr:hypothetical protein [Candidatus Saccharimonadales bacterium]
MEELQAQSPEAYTHLLHIDPQLQGGVSRVLLGLGHRSITTEQTTAQPETSDEIAHGERVSQMMAEAARVTTLASNRLGNETDSETTMETTFVAAMDIALDEAQKSKAANDAHGATRALENMLVIGMLLRVNSDSHAFEHVATVKKRVCEAVAAGMGSETLSAVHDMHGVVADGGVGNIIDGPRLLQDEANLLRAATATDFDDSFEHPNPLSGEAGEQRQAQIVDNLDAVAQRLGSVRPCRQHI